MSGMSRGRVQDDKQTAAKGTPQRSFALQQEVPTLASTDHGLLQHFNLAASTLLCSTVFY